MDEFKGNINISDSDLVNSFIEINCYIRLAVMKRLAYNWEELNEKKQFALAVAFLEQFIAFLESVEMLLYAMIDKGKDFDKPLFYYYKKTNIKESQRLNDKSIEYLKRAFECKQSNSDFCNLFGLDIDKLPIDSNGTEFRVSLSKLIDYLDAFRGKMPLVKAYNSSKHGMLVRQKNIENSIYIEFIIDMEPIDKSKSKATYTGFTVNSKLLRKLIKDTEIHSENFRALFLILKEGYK